MYCIFSFINNHLIKQKYDIAHIQKYDIYANKASLLDFLRNHGSVKHVRMLRVNRLAAEDDELRLASNIASGPEQVSNINLFHEGLPLPPGAIDQRRASTGASDYYDHHDRASS